LVQILSADCPNYGFCVTSLNMRKWMRERLQRRKKKTDEPPAQAAAPPLQPAYFDAAAPAKSQAPEDESHAAVEDEPASSRSSKTDAEIVEASSDNDAADDRGASEATQEPATSSRTTNQSARNSGQRGRARRKRGGRGRGGSGRERAVAQAFAPASAKESAATADDAEGQDGHPAIPEGEDSAAAEAPKIPAAPQASQRPPKGLVVLAIGLPGSGKSTWFKRHNIAPLSSDMIRSLLFDDVREQRFQDLVFSNLRSMLKARLIAKRPTNYVDATNLTPQERQHWIKLAKDYGYEVHALFFDVPLEVCVERHHRRDRVVPEDIMRRMASKLKPPSFSEGFAKITVVRVKKKDGIEA
jgi:predicted kinase